MTTPTKFASAILAILVVGGILVVSLGPKMEMQNSNRFPSIISVTEMPASSPSPGSSGTRSSLPVLSERMPDFTGITRWWNTADGQPLTAEKLNGKVVLIDFWTYSCINCIRTYPFIRAMHEKYAEKGLVIIGVHTPEFAFEGDPENVSREITKNNLKHPIALDPNYGTWNAYGNQYWPAGYFFDRQGRLRRTHFGEGEYAESEEAIRSLLAEAPGISLEPAGSSAVEQDFSMIRTPETYFGLSRGEEFVGVPGTENVDVSFTVESSVPANQWSVDGTWKFRQEYVQANSQNALFRFNVQANKLHLVLESADGKDKTINIYVDGVKVRSLTVNASTLYNIAEFLDAGRHTVEIRLPEPGVRFYAATFS